MTLIREWLVRVIKCKGKRGVKMTLLAWTPEDGREFVIKNGRGSIVSASRAEIATINRVVNRTIREHAKSRARERARRRWREEPGGLRQGIHESFLAHERKTK